MLNKSITFLTENKLVGVFPPTFIVGPGSMHDPFVPAQPVVAETDPDRFGNQKNNKNTRRFPQSSIL